MPKTLVMASVGLLVAATVLAGAQRGRAPRLDEPFRGVTTAGESMPGLYEIRATGVSTEPIVRAAEVFLATLTSEQRAASTFPIDDDEWRLWHNVHRYRGRSSPRSCRATCSPPRSATTS